MAKVLFLCCLVLVALSATSKYYGTRVVLTQDMMAKNLFTTLKKAYEAVGNKQTIKLGPLSDISGTGISKQGLNIPTISHQSYKMTFGDYKYDSKSWKDQYFNTTLPSTTTQFVMDIDFNWEFELLGIHAMFGTGTAHVETSKIHLGCNLGNVVPFSEHIACWVHPEWKISIGDIKGIWGTKKVKEMIVTTMEKALPVNLTNQFVFPHLAYPVGDTVLSNIEFAQTNFDRGMEILVINTLRPETVANTEDKIVLDFYTNVTAKNRPFNKAIWREIETEIPAGDVSVCMNLALVPTTLEVLGKARYFYMLITDKIATVKPQMSTFTNVIPQLWDTFAEDEKVNMGCRSSNNYDVVDLKPTTDGKHQMQIPVDCLFSADSTGETFLKTEVFIRAFYEPRGDEANGFTAKITSPTVYGVRPSVTLDMQGEAALMNIMQEIANYLHEKDALTPGLTAKLMTEGMTFKSADVRAEDICFTWDAQLVSY